MEGVAGRFQHAGIAGQEDVSLVSTRIFLIAAFLPSANEYALHDTYTYTDVGLLT